MQSCISDVKAWATANMPKLNNNKTELMLVTSRSTKHLHNLPTSITIGNAQIPSKQSVKKLCFTLNCHLTMNAHVTNIAQTSYFELRRLASIRRFLTSTATATHVSAFALSKIDYCSSMLFGYTNDVTSHLKRIQKSYFNISVSKPSTLYRTVRNIANIDRPSFIAELSSVSEFSSVENANQFCDFLRTVLDKHAPPSLRKVITHSSSPWFESIIDELFIAKRERRQAERKWRNTKLAIFKDLYGQAKHKVSILVHTAKCKFYTERIALASSSKELHQIVNTLSNIHPPKILPTIYPSDDLPSIFIKHFTNKVEKLRANIASEHVTSTLVTGTTAATFSSFEKVS